MNRNSTPSLDGILENARGLGANAAALAVLQAKLAAIDLHEAGVRMLPALVASIILVPLAGATATGALLGLAYWLRTRFDFSLPPAFGLAALAGLVTCSLLALLAWWRFRVGMLAFRRSREELERNIAWLGTVITRSGR
jgi:hypothetical protein